MNQYEVMYIIDTALEDQARNDIIARFSGLVEQNGGTVDRVDEWGKRRLAYTINYKTEGYYVLMYIQAPADLPRELERNLQISESILRYLVIRFEGALPAKREPLKPYVPAQAAAPAAPAAEAAPAADAEVQPAIEAEIKAVEAVAADASDEAAEAVETVAEAVEAATPDTEA